MAVQTAKDRVKVAVIFGNILFLLHASFSAKRSCHCIFNPLSCGINIEILQTYLIYMREMTVFVFVF